MTPMANMASTAAAFISPDAPVDAQSFLFISTLRPSPHKPQQFRVRKILPPQKKL
jgi:hypothetical protein